MANIGKYWAIIGQILANIGQILANIGKYWANIGQILGKYWANIGQILGNIGQILGKYWAILGNIGQILATLYLFCCCLDFESQLHFQHLKLVYSTPGLLFSTFHMNHDEFGQSLENSGHSLSEKHLQRVKYSPSTGVNFVSIGFPQKSGISPVLGKNGCNFSIFQQLFKNIFDNLRK